MRVQKFLYGFLCVVPLLLVIVVYLLLQGEQSHHDQNCRQFVATHVATDVAEWQHFICHNSP